MLCRTEKPTEAQVNAVTAKAEDLLRRMELGQWDVIETEIETQQIGDSVEYTVHVRAAPVLNGISVLYGQPTSFFQDDYKPTYLMTKAEFIFSANGDVIFFDMCSPMDIVETRNTNVQVLPLEELFEKARQHLSFSDADAYGFPARLRNRIEKSSEEHIICNVNISQLYQTFLSALVLLICAAAQMAGQHRRELQEALPERQALALSGLEEGQLWQIFPLRTFFAELVCFLVAAVVAGVIGSVSLLGLLVGELGWIIHLGIIVLQLSR